MPGHRQADVADRETPADRDPTEFRPSPGPSFGIEIELALVGEQGMALRGAAPAILASLPPALRMRVKPELTTSHIEVNSAVCNTMAEAEADLTRTLTAVERAADAQGVRLFWSGCHPFSSWRDQVPTPDPRYQRLLGLLQDSGRQLVIFGLHVHVGVGNGDLAARTCNALARHLPLLLAASCNSPVWEGRATGMLSQRAGIIRQLPTADLAPPMRTWAEYNRVIKSLTDSGFIESARDLWWPARPRGDYGTVEIRVCDTPGCLKDALALAALARELVRLAANAGPGESCAGESADAATESLLLRQNLWHAQRFGLDARLFDPTRGEPQPARRMLANLVDIAARGADDASSAPYFERLRLMATLPTGAERQLTCLQRVGSAADMIRETTALSRITRPAPVFSA